MLRLDMCPSLLSGLRKHFSWLPGIQRLAQDDGKPAEDAKSPEGRSLLPGIAHISAIGPSPSTVPHTPDAEELPAPLGWKQRDCPYLEGPQLFVDCSDGEATQCLDTFQDKLTSNGFYSKLAWLPQPDTTAIIFNTRTQLVPVVAIMVRKGLHKCVAKNTVMALPSRYIMSKVADTISARSAPLVDVEVCRRLSDFASTKANSGDYSLVVVEKIEIKAKLAGVEEERQILQYEDVFYGGLQYAGKGDQVPQDYDTVINAITAQMEKVVVTVTIPSGDSLEFTLNDFLDWPFEKLPHLRAHLCGLHLMQVYLDSRHCALTYGDVWTAAKRLQVVELMAAAWRQKIKVSSIMKALPDVWMEYHVLLGLQVAPMSVQPVADAVRYCWLRCVDSYADLLTALQLNVRPEHLLLMPFEQQYLDLLVTAAEAAATPSAADANLLQSSAASTAAGAEAAGSSTVWQQYSVADAAVAEAAQLALPPGPEAAPPSPAQQMAPAIPSFLQQMLGLTPPARQHGNRQGLISPTFPTVLFAEGASAATPPPAAATAAAASFSLAAEQEAAAGAVVLQDAAATSSSPAAAAAANSVPPKLLDAGEVFTEELLRFTHPDDWVRFAITSRSGCPSLPAMVKDHYKDHGLPLITFRQFVQQFTQIEESPPPPEYAADSTPNGPSSTVKGWNLQPVRQRHLAGKSIRKYS